MTAGDVVLLTFPFSDLSGAKLRPAVLLAGVDAHEFIACQITSKQKTDSRSIELLSRSFAAGGLRMISYARPAKLFTVHRSIVVRRVARIRNEVLEMIRGGAVKAIRER